jgi:hypothetical protein
MVGILAVAAEAAPAKGCPNENSGFAAYPINGSLGDPAPAAGVEPLWDQVVAGAEQEGLTIQELAASLNLDVDGLYGFALSGWLGLDKNGDGVLCNKPFAEQGKGRAAYLLNFIDNNAAR